MQGGRLRIEGESVDTEEAKTDGNAAPEEVYDGAGNKITVNKAATLSDKDRKKAIKDLEKKIKDGKKKKTLTEEEVWELEDQLTELKEGLKQSSRGKGPLGRLALSRFCASCCCRHKGRDF